jgi:CelD/BcsL family acetyltransferase involved in cellulose biosynthesis
VTRGRRIEIITQAERLLAIEPAWQALFAEATLATPFQSPDWLLPWSHCFVEHGCLRVLVLWSGARALLCWPLRRFELDGRRRLGWLGEGLSDYLDVLAAPDADAAAFQTAWDALRELEADADQIELGDLPASSPLLTRSAPGWRLEGWRLQVAAQCPRLEPGVDPAAFERTLPPWLLRNLQRSERRLQARDALRWHLARPEEATARLEELFAVHRARWQSQGEPGVLAHPSVQAFQRAAAPRLLARGLLQLEIAHQAGRPVAAGYTLVRRDAYLYLNGFDPSVTGVSLGSLVIARAVRRAIDEARDGVDFLRGQEPYKYAWGARDRQTYRLLRSTHLEQSTADAQPAA